MKFIKTLHIPITTTLSRQLWETDLIFFFYPKIHIVISGKYFHFENCFVVPSKPFFFGYVANAEKRQSQTYEVQQQTPQKVQQ